MDRRQLLVTTGAVVSAGVAGCMGEDEEAETPDEPYVADTDFEDQPLTLSVAVVNPTSETVDVDVWGRLLDDQGETLEVAGPITLNAIEADDDANVVFLENQDNGFSALEYLPNDVADHDARLTAVGAASPY